MAEIKTKRNQADPVAFIESVDDVTRRDDARALLKIMSEVTGEAPAMWGASIIGFGTQTYRYASGKEAEWMKIGFSPRKAELVLYGLIYYDAADHPHQAGLGPHRKGKGCLYIKSLSQVDTKVLRRMIQNACKMKSHKEGKQ